MRKLLVLLILLKFLPAKAQCPDKDSILANRQIITINPYYPVQYPPYWSYPLSIPVFCVNDAKPKIPPVNGDIKTSKRKVDRKGYATLYYQDIADSVVLAKGPYRNGKKSGRWIWFYTNGDKAPWLKQHYQLYLGNTKI
jgi:hypothetical protein